MNYSNVELDAIFESTTLLSQNFENGSGFRHFSQLRQYFKWYDYILFSSILVASAAVGVYHACYRKYRTTEEYLMGGRNMGFWPLSISLIAGHTSGFALMGLPADIYMLGIHFMLAIFAYILTGFFVAFVIMPVFFSLKIGSTYEYLEKRFDRRCRMFASGVFLVCVVLFLPIVVYTPALAFQTVTGSNYQAIVVILCSVCIFYTALGGFRAVVWTDILQFTITVSTIFAALVLSIRENGGLGNILEAARSTDRLNISFKVDFTERETFWSIMVGLTIFKFGEFGINHSNVQKWLAVRNYKSSIKMVFVYVIGMGLRNIVLGVMSLAIFARYNGCDPLTSRQIDRQDQIVPYFMMDVSEELPGIGGLFIAGLFCAELSTLSAFMNAAVSTVHEDFLKNWLARKNDVNFTSRCLKLVSIAIGVSVFGLVFIVQKMGGVFSLAMTLLTVSYGPLLSLFSLGLLFPDANSMGAFWGTVMAYIFGVVIVGGNSYYKYIGVIKASVKPLSVENCSFPVNVTVPFQSIIVTQPNVLFRLAFYWYAAITSSLGIISGLIISYLTGKNERPVDIKLLSPCIHSWYRKRLSIDMMRTNGVELTSINLEEERLDNRRLVD